MTESPFFLPEWWDYAACIHCMRHNLGMCASCEIPPGLLGLAQLVGGGTVAIGGSMTGNVGIALETQAVAAARQHGVDVVSHQLERQSTAVERAVGQMAERDGGNL